jgi:hypothetical protein
MKCDFEILFQKVTVHKECGKMKPPHAASINTATMYVEI